MKNATDAMKEARVADILNMVRKFDVTRFPKPHKANA